ncbi:MAG TPA: DUF58 domain-containing protein [Chloroflexi bacterium]|nr:DUF58 domain-containing protein [Chloroflexota bacterium]
MRKLFLVFSIWAVCLALMLNTGNELFQDLFYLFSGLIILSFLWTWLNLRGLEIEMIVPSIRTQVGQVMEEELVIRNTSPLPKFWLEVRDHSTLPGHTAGRVISSLGRRKERRWPVKTLCRKRGIFTLGPITVVSSDPLGLMRLARTFPISKQLLVYPATFPLPYFELRTGELPGGEAVRRRTHYVTTNVAGVRDYFPGDSFNRIHWPTTAHVGHLMVKEFELDPLSDIWLFLDVQESAQRGVPWSKSILEQWGPALIWSRTGTVKLEPTTEEYGIAVAASLAKHLLAKRRAVGLVAQSRRRYVIRPERGERQLVKILETLAMIKADGITPFEYVLAADGLTLERNSTIVAITPSWSASWARVLHRIKARGLEVLAVLLAAETFGSAPSYTDALAELRAGGIPVILLRNGDEISATLRLL